MSLIKILSGGGSGKKGFFAAGGGAPITSDVMTLRSCYNGRANWRSGACSRDGRYQVLCNDGFIFNSSDYGVTWTQRLALVANWQRTCCSDSGQYFYALAVIGATGLYKSSDYGVTWAACYVPAGTVTQDITCNSTGQYLLFTSQTGANAMRSTDYGVNWGNSKATLGVRLRPAMSANGAIQYLLDQNGQIYKSTDYGVTWGAALPIVATGGYTDKLACSADGSTLYAYIADGQVWISLDSGATWTPRGFHLFQNSSNNQGGDIWCSTDGRYALICQVQAVSTRGDYLFTQNYGVSWKNIYPRMTSYVVLASNDLRYITRAAVDANVSVYQGGIYIKA